MDDVCCALGEFDTTVSNRIHKLLGKLPQTNQRIGVPLQVLAMPQLLQQGISMLLGIQVACMECMDVSKIVDMLKHDKRYNNTTPYDVLVCVMHESSSIEDAYDGDDEMHSDLDDVLLKVKD